MHTYYGATVIPCTMAKTGISLPDEMEERINSQLSYGDNRSAWIRYAIRLRFHTDPMLDELFEPDQTEKRLQFVEAAVRQEVDKVKKNPNYDGPNGGPPGE